MAEKRADQILPAPYLLTSATCSEQYYGVSKKFRPTSILTVDNAILTLPPSHFASSPHQTTIDEMPVNLQGEPSSNAMRCERRTGNERKRRSADLFPAHLI